MSPAGTPPLLKWLAPLSDLARLRLLRLLDREELSVGELAKVLQLPQSTVSRHLKLLHEVGWIVKRTEGTASLYRMDEFTLGPAARRLWGLVRGEVGSSATFAEEDHRLTEVLAERRTDAKAFFGRIGGDWDDLRGELFGKRFTGESLLSFLDPDWVVADLGCGTGAAAENLAPVVKRIMAVDREPTMLEAARARLSRFDNVEFRQGDLADLPIEDEVVDATIVLLVMVYLPEPIKAVAEMARILRPGGVAMIVDVVPHDRESYRHTMGHHHLGFDEAQVSGWAEAAGLADVHYRRLRPDTSAKGPGLFVATLKKT